MSQFGKSARRRFETASAGYHDVAHLQAYVAGRLIRLAAPMLRREGTSLLEIGCGSGHVMRALVRHKIPYKLLLPRRCLLSDVSYGMVARCRVRAPHPSASYCVCDGMQLPCKRGFDVVVASMSLHWFEDMRAALESFMGVMASKGVLLLAFPGAGSLESFHRLCGHVPFTFPRSGEIHAQLKAAGLRVSKHDDIIEDSYETLRDFLCVMRAWGVMTPHKRLVWRRATAIAGGTQQAFAGKMAYTLRGGDMRGYFVTGTGTSVGKTLLSAYLVRVLDGFYWKPIQCGVPTDCARVQALSGLDGSRFCDSVYELRAARSPHEAAEMQGETIQLQRIRCPDKTPLVVEGAGGVLVPINETSLMVDMMLQLKLPTIVVASSALGTINHTLLTLEALRRRHVDICGVVLCGERDDANQRAIETYGRVKVLCTFIVEGWVESLQDERLRIIDVNKGKW